MNMSWRRLVLDGLMIFKALVYDQKWTFRGQNGRLIVRLGDFISGVLVMPIPEFASNKHTSCDLLSHTCFFLLKALSCNALQVALVGYGCLVRIALIPYHVVNGTMDVYCRPCERLPFGLSSHRYSIPRRVPHGTSVLFSQHGHVIIVVVRPDAYQIRTVGMVD